MPEETAGMIDLRKRMLKYVRHVVGMQCTNECWQNTFTVIINQHPDDPMQWLEEHIEEYTVAARLLEDVT